MRIYLLIVASAIYIWWMNANFAHWRKRLHWPSHIA